MSEIYGSELIFEFFLHGLVMIWLSENAKIEKFGRSSRSPRFEVIFT